MYPRDTQTHGEISNGEDPSLYGVVSCKLSCGLEQAVALEIGQALTTVEELADQ